jgi:hypothetical protein
MMQVSKSWNKLASKDELWKPHLKFLLEKLFDDAVEPTKDAKKRGITAPPVPIGERDNFWSSKEFLARKP